jgi:hypothetical protein
MLGTTSDGTLAVNVAELEPRLRSPPPATLMVVTVTVTVKLVALGTELHHALGMA